MKHICAEGTALQMCSERSGDQHLHGVDVKVIWIHAARQCEDELESEQISRDHLHLIQSCSARHRSWESFCVLTHSQGHGMLSCIGLSARQDSESFIRREGSCYSLTCTLSASFGLNSCQGSLMAHANSRPTRDIDSDAPAVAESIIAGETVIVG